MMNTAIERVMQEFLGYEIRASYSQIKCYRMAEEIVGLRKQVQEQTQSPFATPGCVNDCAPVCTCPKEN